MLCVCLAVEWADGPVRQTCAPALPLQRGAQARPLPPSPREHCLQPPCLPLALLPAASHPLVATLLVLCLDLFNFRSNTLLPANAMRPAFSRSLHLHEGCPWGGASSCCCVTSRMIAWFTFFDSAVKWRHWCRRGSILEKF